MTQPDEVTVEDAYAAALEEIARLQQRVIMGQALIFRLKREVGDGPQGSGDTGDERGVDSPHDFSD